jgi:hypothetical protein
LPFSGVEGRFFAELGLAHSPQFFLPDANSSGGVNKIVIQKLNELRPVRYEFKDQSSHPSGEQIGLVAQDVQTEFPSLVSKSAGGYLSLAYPKMTAVILKGIQEQQAELEKKQVQIDSLKGRVQRLKKQQQEIDRVKGRLAALEAERNPSVMAGLTGPVAGLLLGLFLGGLLGAGLLWRRRAAGPSA